jgi:hypothetical protein
MRRPSAKQFIRDKNYRVIRSIDVDSSGKQVGYDPEFHRVGEYDPKADKTRQQLLLRRHLQLLSALV